MAWRCSAGSNAGLVKNLRLNGLFVSDRTEAAMLATDRRYYVADGLRPYEDSPQPIGHRATISAPHVHCSALDILSPALTEVNCTVLDVGCGSGYLAACLYRLTSEQNGKVVAVDYLKALVELSRENITRDNPGMLEGTRKIEVLQGDGWKGVPEFGPYDAIHVGAAAEEIPSALVASLRVGGKMVIPVGPAHTGQEMMLVTKLDEFGRFSTEKLSDVIFVPLVRLGGAT